MRRTHYEVLGIGRNASPAQIKAAYRRLVFEVHPDTSSDGGSTEAFIEIAQSYEVLADPGRRASYDRSLNLQEHPPKPRAKQKPPEPHRSRPRPPEATPPGTPDILKLTSLLNRGRFVDAENLAKKIVDQDPKQPIPYAVLGDLAKMRGHVRRAAEMYAYAAQMDPGNPIYERKHEELIRSRAGVSDTTKQGGLVPVLVGVGVVAVAGVYIALAKEPAFALDLDPISTWTVGLLLMLFVSGVAMGSSLTVAGLMERFSALQGTAVMKVSPMVALGVVAMANFWVALVLYFLVGASQNAYNESSSRAMASVAGTTAFLTIAASIQGTIEPLQVLLWGGNVVYIGLLVGWMVADGLKD